MKKSFEENVMVWTPDNDEDVNSGVITFSQKEGVYLTLFRNETKSLHESFNQKSNENIEILNGYTQNGKLLTLYDCMMVNSSSALFTGFSSIKFRAKFLFIGECFSNYDEIKFHALYGNFTDLSNWTKVTGFDFSHQTINDSTINYSKPARRLISLDNDLAVGFSFAYQEKYNTKSIHAEEFPQIFVESKNKYFHFEKLHQYLYSFSSLLQIACQRKVYPLTILGSKEETDGEGNARPVNVEVYYNPIEPIHEQKPLISSDYLFLFDDLDDEMIKNWFYIYKEYKTEINLHRTLFYKERGFIETRFIDIATALESLHGHLYDNNFLDKKLYKQRVQEILETAPPEYHDWLVNLFSYGNNKSFKDRLIELIKPKECLLCRVIVDVDEFVLAVRDTRNELVHHNKNKRTLSGSDLLYSIYILRFVFEAYLCELIGLQEEQITKLFKKRITNFLSWGNPM